MSVNRDWAQGMMCIRIRMILRSVGSPVMGVTGVGKPARMVALSFSAVDAILSCDVLVADTGIPGS